MQIFKFIRYDFLAKFAFIIYIIFTFYPTSMPFKSTLQERGAEAIGSSNIINQIIYSSIFILTTIAAIPKLNQIYSLIKQERAIIIFLIWALVTIIWSDFPFVSFKRWFQIFTFYWVTLVYFAHYPYIDDLIKLIKPIIYSYILITLAVCLLIPEAKDPEFNTWRGLTLSKNNLGQVGLILSVLTLIIVNFEKEIIKKNIAVLFFILSITISLATFSSTTYISLFIFLSGSLVFYLSKKFWRNLGVGYAFTIILSAFLVTLGGLIFYFDPTITDFIQGIFGKSETFYDRGKLWSVMIWNISQHPIIGCGFQGFWVIESPKIQLLYQSFIWLPIQAHNGYLDMINETGLVGFAFFLGIIMKYFITVITRKRLQLWAWFLILPLISSVTESLLFRTSDVNTRMLFISSLLVSLKIEELRDY